VASKKSTSSKTKKTPTKRTTAKKAPAAATAKKAAAEKAAAKKATSAATPRRPARSMTPVRRSSTRATPARPGDLIVIDSAQVGSPPREGEILKVLESYLSVRYQVKWRDGHESLISPAAGTAHIVRSEARRRT
jgi:acyl-CoA reductase-like NAD-dependent aldehyde dehydrogenase